MVRIDKIEKGTYNIEFNGYDYIVNGKTIKDKKGQFLVNSEYDCLIYELTKAIWKQNTIIRQNLIANKF